MPATLRGIYNYNIYPQPDFVADQDQNGAWTARQSYIVTKATWQSTEWRNKFALGTQITVINPTLADFYSFLRIASISFTEDGGDIVTISVEFSGSSSSQYGFDENDITPEAEPTYRLEGRLTEKPLSEHPKWQGLSEVERNTLQLLLNDQAIWQWDSVSAEYGAWWPRNELQQAKLPDSEQLVSVDAISFADLIADGIKTYVFPTIIWTETTSGNSPMSSSQLDDLGKIVLNPRGNAPVALGFRNWMLTSATQEQRGSLYQTTLEWTMSEKFGWSEFLYSD